MKCALLYYTGVSARRLLPPNRSVLRRKMIEDHQRKGIIVEASPAVQLQSIIDQEDVPTSNGSSSSSSSSMIISTLKEDQIRSDSAASSQMRGIDPDEAVVIIRDRSQPSSGRRSRRSPNSMARKVVHTGTVLPPSHC